MSMTKHKLEVARTIDGFENVLVKNLTPVAAQEALFPERGMYAGRCGHRDSNGEFTLGVDSRHVPFWMFRTSNWPSTGLSDPTAIASAPSLTYKDGSTHVVLCYAGIEGLELETTEFDDDSGTPYDFDQFLRAPVPGGGDTDAEIVASAGVVTNENVTHGIDPIVGIVSESNKNKTGDGIEMLRFYTLYRPPIEGLPDGFAEPTWSV